ncbi:hypothetical protein GCM10009611_13960 [Arthrobacter roseus]
MHNDGSEQENGDERRKNDEDQIHGHLKGIKVWKPRLKGQREQESDKNLDTCLKDPQLLQKLMPVTIQPLKTGFIASITLGSHHVVSFGHRNSVRRPL